jgi:hypothetical protein
MKLMCTEGMSSRLPQSAVTVTLFPEVFGSDRAEFPSAILIFGVSETKLYAPINTYTGDYNLLGCDVMQSGKYIPVAGRNMLFPSLS